MKASSYKHQASNTLQINRFNYYYYSAFQKVSSTCTRYSPPTAIIVLQNGEYLEFYTSTSVRPTRYGLEAVLTYCRSKDWSVILKPIVPQKDKHKASRQLYVLTIFPGNNCTSAHLQPTFQWLLLTLPGRNFRAACADSFPSQTIDNLVEVRTMPSFLQS